MSIQVPDALQSLFRICIIFLLSACFYIIIFWQTAMYGFAPIGDVIVLLTFLFAFRSDHVLNLKHIHRGSSWFLTIILILSFGIALFSTSTFVNINISFGFLLSWIWIFFRAFWEEVIFRGILFAKFIDKQKSVRIVWVMLLSALLFTIVHAGNYISFHDYRSYILYVFLWGIIFCELFVITRNLIFSIIFHFFVNIFINRFPNALTGFNESSTWIILGTQVFFVLILAIIWIKKIGDSDLIWSKDGDRNNYMSQIEKNENLSKSFRDTWQELINTIRSLNKLVPGCTTVLLAIGITFVWIVSTFSSSLATAVTLGVLILISVIVYAGTQNYGESALALSAGLLAVFSVQWNGEKAAIFLFVWIAFSLITFLIYGVSSASKNEAILREAALALDIENVDENEKMLRKIINNEKRSQLGPLDKADIIRIFAYRKLPLSIMPYGLKAVSTLYTISRGEYKTIALFILDVYQMFGLKGTNDKKYARLLDQIYNVIRNTPASPVEFIDAFNKSRRYALSSSIDPNQFINEISSALLIGVSADEMYDHLVSQNEYDD